MSTGPKMSLPFARNLARRIVDLLEWDCDRIEVAGSVRRCKSEVSDIELVLIPKPEYDLLGYPLFGSGRIASALEDNGFVLEKNGERYKQAHLPGSSVMLDIFLTTPEQWGVIYTIRTGSADFAQWLVTPRNKGGALPSNLQVKDGLITCRGFQEVKVIPTLEEADVFEVVHLDYILPEKRTEGSWRR